MYYKRKSNVENANHVHRTYVEEEKPPYEENTKDLSLYHMVHTCDDFAYQCVEQYFHEMSDICSTVCTVTER